MSDDHQLQLAQAIANAWRKSKGGTEIIDQLIRTGIGLAWVARRPEIGATEFRTSMNEILSTVIDQVQRKVGPRPEGPPHHNIDITAMSLQNKTSDELIRDLGTIPYRLALAGMETSTVLDILMRSVASFAYVVKAEETTRLDYKDLILQAMAITIDEAYNHPIVQEMRAKMQSSLS